MFKNNLLLSFRSLGKSKLYTVVNVVSLALAVTTSLLILNYAVFELSYDDFHKNSDNIYRVESQFYEGDVLTDDWATSSYGYGVAMQNEMSGIRNMVRLDINNTEQIVSHGDQRHRESNVTYTEPSFFDIFSFELSDGDRTTALDGPNKVVISQVAAAKYFPNQDPIGKRLKFNSLNAEHNCEVTGILKDIPQNSCVRFDFFISWKTLPKWLDNYWYRHEVYTYVELDPLANPSDIEAGFPALSEKYKTEDALRNKTWSVVLNPMSDIHLTSMKQYERETKGNRNSINILIIIAISILVIAWINYVNLATARAAERAKEIGIRKVSGAVRMQLIWQFLCDSLLTNIMAFILAGILVGCTTPLFNALTGKIVTLVILGSPWFWIGIVSIFVLGVLLSGLYPAYIISAVKPLAVLRGSFIRSKGAGAIRHVLVVIQFTAAIVLLSGTMIIWWQIKYMQAAPLGINIDNVVAIKFPAQCEDFQQKLMAFKRDLEKNPLTRHVSFSNSVPGMEVATFLSNRLASDATLQNRLYEMVVADYDYNDTYDLPIIQGRAFSEDFTGDDRSLIVNRASCEALNITDLSQAIGQKVLVETLEEPLEIIGVVENYHQQTLAKNYTPLMFIRENCIEWIPLKFISVRFDNSNDMDTYLVSIETTWNGFFPESTFDSFFVDKFYAAGYNEENNFALIFAFFAVLALCISVVGLLVLTLFSLSVRKREIAVRKVFGAIGRDIFGVLSGEFLVLIGVSVLIGVPLAWWTMNGYLESYPFRIDTAWWMFALPVAIVGFVTFSTIGALITATMRSKPKLR